MSNKDAELHVVVGAGAIGATTARLLADAGHRVKLVSRSGSSPTGTGIEAFALDASSASDLSRVATGATAIYNCANPPYARWATDWPALGASLLNTAERTGAVLATMSNLYMYADPTEPMTESSPLSPSSRKGQIRADLWNSALESHKAGRSRVTEARASDFFGPEVGQNGHMGDRVIPRALKGKAPYMVGEPTKPHSWTAVGDAARALVTIAAAPSAWGRPWHVPTAQPLSATDLVHRLCELAGTKDVTVRPAPKALMRMMAVFSADLRELAEMLYQFDKPFVVDSSAFSSEFGWDHTPLDDTLKSLIAFYKD